MARSPVLWPTDAADRGLGGIGFEHRLLLSFRKRVPPGRVDHARGDAIYPQRLEFDGKDRDERRHRGIGGADPSRAGRGGMGGDSRDEGKAARRIQEWQRRLGCREMREDLFLEAELHIGEAHAGEGAYSLAAAERQNQVIELADLRELRGKRVRRCRAIRKTCASGPSCRRASSSRVSLRPVIVTRAPEARR